MDGQQAINRRHIENLILDILSDGSELASKDIAKKVKDAKPRSVLYCITGLFKKNRIAAKHPQKDFRKIVYYRKDLQ